MGITRQNEMIREQIVQIVKFLDEKFSNNQPCVSGSEIKNGIVIGADENIDPVLEVMVKKRIIRYGPYGFGDDRMDGYQKGINYVNIKSALGIN